MTLTINFFENEVSADAVRHIAMLIEEGYTNGIRCDGTTWSIENE